MSVETRLTEAEATESVTGHKPVSMLQMFAQCMTERPQEIAEQGPIERRIAGATSNKAAQLLITEMSSPDSANISISNS